MDYGIDLYWLPLGAGGHFVRWNGRVFEALVARRERRPPCDLYHSALEVRTPAGRFVIEQTPACDHPEDRGVVLQGPVGARSAGRFRIFRYEVRCWRDGVIPDVCEAVESPQGLTADPRIAQRILDVAPGLPSTVWGRDEFGAGEMWNSNSVIAWLLTRAGLPAESLAPPRGGRAPGWHAGIVIARQSPEVPSQHDRRQPHAALLGRRPGDSRLLPRHVRLGERRQRRRLAHLRSAAVRARRPSR